MFWRIGITDAIAGLVRGMRFSKLVNGIAIANDLVLVTNNHRDFEKIEGLEIEDWIQT
ncbi:hypothetical protein [Nostoc sphaeroides]|uniref:Type II toxin-antitoxin system VapC family toxin n=1 Tax=Nostoc sphaeroides CCNUC1 TaxID=2653204 RepID=A0A5P8WGM8_9NOSO|nr:hypothetical protein [Nostoc sphaeroides]QFS51993.1 type II toxin-antitoxin system VapC family toxin [Nostoc sphaeroides CCNUC1]